MDAKKREIRTVECRMAFREASPEEAQNGSLGIISGTAIVFNAESRVIDEYGETFREVILPEAVPMEFLNGNDFGKRRIHLCELPLLRMDLERQAKVDQLHLQMGWTVNEIRNQYDMPAIENGDIPYVSTNLAELGSAKLRENGSGRPTEQPDDDSKPEA